MPDFMAMKSLEEIFFKACVHESLRVNHDAAHIEMSVRNIVNVFSRFGFPCKRLWRYLEKWVRFGFYEYGVTLDLGWFEIDKLPPQYMKLYKEVKNTYSCSDWEDGEFTEYIVNKMHRNLVSTQTIKPTFKQQSDDVDKFIDVYRNRMVEATGVPSELFGTNKTLHLGRRCKGERFSNG